MGDSRDRDQMDLVVDYSLGLLSSDQEKVLLATARANPELDAMLRQQCEDYRRLRASRKPRKVAVNFRTDRITPLPLLRQPRTWLLTTALAASVALFVGLNPGSDSDQYWLPVDDAMLVQRSHSAVDEGLRQGIEFYSVGELPQAITALQGAELQGAMRDVRDIYLASALINAGRPLEAHIIIEDMDLDSLPTPWRSYGYELQELSTAP